jgi:hypothetical protein
MILAGIVHRGTNAMARKKPKETKPITGLETEFKSIRLELSLEDHKRFRVESAKEGLRMAAVARRLIEDYLSNRKASGK